MVGGEVADGLVGASTGIGATLETTRSRSSGIRSWQTSPGMLRHRAWLGSCMPLASGELWSATKQRYPPQFPLHTQY